MSGNVEVPTLAGVVLDGKYRIGHIIGQGGMGAVYQARHVGTERPVAVKVLLSSLVRSPDAVERFRREAKAAGRLRHPNIVDVTDFGIAPVGEQSVAYLVMEYLEGSTLRRLLEERGALPVEIVVGVVEQIRRSGLSDRISRERAARGDRTALQSAVGQLTPCLYDRACFHLPRSLPFFDRGSRPDLHVP